MLAVMNGNKVVYKCASKTEAELEILECKGLKGFGVYLLELGHRPFQVLQIDGRRALVQARKHRKWVSI